MTLREIEARELDIRREPDFAAAEPVVLRGLVSDWPAVRSARRSVSALAEYLESFATTRPVTAMFAAAGQGGRLFYNAELDGFNFEYLRLTLGEAIRRITALCEEDDPATLYVGSTNVDHWLPGFRAENDLDLGHLGPLVSIWLGNRSRIAAHCDFPANLACVVAGKRRFTLFPPEQLDNLYVGPLAPTPAGQPISLVDLEDPDYERFPRFRAALAASRSVTLEAGDAIHIPSMWWHHIEAMDAFNVLVNYWWRSTPAYRGAPMNALLHAILALKDLPAGELAAWKRTFDHYVFAPDPGRFDHIPTAAKGVLGGVDEDSAKAIRSALRKRLL